jgi:2-iminobutanoate/2-iminopropanoate deaminase
MNHKIVEVGVARQIGAYSDGIEVKPGLRWLMTSGTPGLATDGQLPEGIEAQAVLAWEHALKMLHQADMGIADIVKVTHYLIRSEDISAYAKVRSRFLGEMRPASMLLIVPQLVRPEFLLEIEVIAAKA